MKKPKHIFIILFFVWLPILLNSCSYNKTHQDEEIDMPSETKIISDELQRLENTSKEQPDEISTDDIDIPEFSDQTQQKPEITDEEKEKLEVLRKRFALKGIIEKWDSYIESNQLNLAILEYNQALKQNPKDITIIKKVANTYFELKRYQNAKKYYEEIYSSLNDEEKYKYLLSLFYTTDMHEDSSIEASIQSIQDMHLSPEDTFYYLNSLECIKSFHSCKKNFEEYFTQNPNFTSQRLKNIQQAMQNYLNFRIHELYYKDALIISVFFQDQLYSLSNKLAEDLLEQKPDYKPMLLISGKWYLELRFLGPATKALEQYYKLEPENITTSYLLWDISFQLRDYTTSNLYFNTALKNGYQPRIELQRRLAYNYYLAWDKRSMLNMFNYIIEDSNATMDDFSLAIYHGILEKRSSSAISWANIGKDRFQDQKWYEIFDGYLGWIYREAKKYDEARQYLTDGLKLNPRNPLITLNYGYLEESQWEYTKALIYFNRTVNLNQWWEFWELARKEIQAIERYLAEQEK